MEYDGAEYNPKHHPTVQGLSPRERWLVIEGFVAGYADGVMRSDRASALAAKWLDDYIVDNVTVSMALDHEAKRHSESMGGKE